MIGKSAKNGGELSRILARPRLKKTTMLAAWPGVANVATIIAYYLKEHLAFKPLATLNATHFFDPIGVLVRNDLVESPQFPESSFYYWKNPDWALTGSVVWV